MTNPARSPGQLAPPRIHARFHGDPVDSPTFWQDIAPIYFASCVSCHQPGGIGPFRLDVYDDAKTWAAASSSVVTTRIMPPWLVTDDGTCGTFRDSPTLTDDEIATIEAWAAAGAPEGEPRDDLERPRKGQAGRGRDPRTVVDAPGVVHGWASKTSSPGPDPRRR